MRAIRIFVAVVLLSISLWYVAMISWNRTSDLLTRRRSTFASLCAELDIESRGSGAHCEQLNVQTSDGFTLEMHRIRPRQWNGRAVWLQHGLFEESLQWLLSTRDVGSTLPMLLAARGYDVFMGNNRGNALTWHRDFDRDDSRFWGSWSFHEMAMLDWPAMLDAVRSASGVERVSYVGMSQGATQALVALSLLGVDMNERMEAVVLMAPGIHVKPPDNPAISFLFDNIDSGLFDRRGQFALTFEFCRWWLPERFLGTVGESLMSALGFIRSDIDPDTRIFAHIPSGSTSLRNMQHWIQAARTDRPIAPFDQPERPYPFGVITAPIALYMAADDNIVDVDSTIALIPHRRLRIEEDFSHADVVWHCPSTERSLWPQVIQDLIEIANGDP
jgi:lysosomal acid lipase/cholesteryl ester hydrolase